MKKNDYALKLAGLVTEGDEPRPEPDKKSLRTHDWQVLTEAYNQLLDPKIQQAMDTFLTKVVGPMLNRND